MTKNSINEWATISSRHVWHRSVFQRIRFLKLCAKWLLDHNDTVRRVQKFAVNGGFGLGGGVGKHFGPLPPDHGFLKPAGCWSLFPGFSHSFCCRVAFCGEPARLQMCSVCLSLFGFGRLCVQIHGKTGTPRRKGKRLREARSRTYGVRRERRLKGERERRQVRNAAACSAPPWHVSAAPCVQGCVARPGQALVAFVSLPMATGRDRPLNRRCLNLPRLMSKAIG